MKEGWTYKKLGEVCRFFSGFAFKSNKFTENGMPIIRISDIKNGEIDDTNVVYFNPSDYEQDLSRYIIYPGEILIAMSGGTTGKIGKNKTSKEFYLNQRVGAFRENKSIIEHDYLFYYLLTKSKESLRIAAGAAQPNLSSAQINSFIIPVPSLSEQERIVERLDAAFMQIDELKSNAERQLAEARALFQSALTQAMQPKPGWQDFSFSQIIKLKSGDNLPAKSFVEGAYPVYGGNGIAGYHNQYNKEGGQIVIGRVGALCGNVRFIESPFWLTDNGFEVILNKEQKMDLLFLTYLLNFCNLRQYARQAAQPVISNVSLKDIQLSIPPIKEQQAIVEHLDALSNHVKELEEISCKTAAECDAMKQALLTQIFE